MKKDNVCALCERNHKLTFHHLIPKSYQKRKYIAKEAPNVDLNEYGITLCKDCHKHLHKTIPNKDLAKTVNTLERIQSHPEIARFVNWVKKQQKNVKG